LLRAFANRFKKLKIYIFEFVLKKSKIDKIKGGWRVTYKDFDYILLSM